MPDLPEGTVLAGCRIERIAGRGGMGTVYRAKHIRLDRTVAVKVIAAHIGDDPAFQARFEREAKSAASLDHPNVVPVFDAGEADGRLYIIMRWVDGTSLKSLLRSTSLETGDVTTLAMQLSSALSAAHARGLVHRDVKPANVMIEARDPGLHSFLCDFGVAHLGDGDSLTASGDVFGTLDYAAPEQLEGDPADPRSDQYSLACLLFEALTGSVVFVRETQAAKVFAHLHDEPPLDSAQLPATIKPVLQQALQKDPAARFSTIDAFAQAFRTSAERDGEGTTPGETVPLPQARARRRRGRRPAAAASLAVAAAVAFASIALTGGDGDDGARPRSADSRGQVVTVLHAYEKAFTDHDTAGLRAILTPDVFRRGLRDGGCFDTNGRANVLSAYREQFRAGPTVYRLRDLSRSRVRISGDGASLRSRYTIGTGVAGTIRFELRRSDARWRISRIIAPC